MVHYKQDGVKIMLQIARKENKKKHSQFVHQWEKNLFAICNEVLLYRGGVFGGYQIPCFLKEISLLP